MSGLIDVLHSANFNCEKIAEVLHSRQTEQDANDNLGMTPLLEAATLGRLSEVEDLLAAGGDADIRYGSQELSLLDVAALMGHLEVVRALLEHGVNVNGAAAPDGYTALLCAVQYGRADLLVDIVDLLLSAGADIDAPTADGSTPLHLAADRQDCGGVTVALLQRGAAKDALSSVGRSPLHVAARYGNLAATRVLLAAGADTSILADDGFIRKTPLDLAARSGHVEVIGELVRHGVDLDDATYCTALHHAAQKNRWGAVKALIEAGASMTSHALSSATRALALETMVVLLRHGAPVRSFQDGGGRRPEELLHIAARRGGSAGAVEAVDLLLRWGADESKLDNDGKTPAEVAGLDVSPTRRVAADVDRVRELLENAPADRLWRRRGLLLLCLARNRAMMRRRRRRRRRKGKKEGSGDKGESKGKGKGTGERAFAKGGGRSGSGDGAVPSPANVGALASAAKERRGKRERTPSEVGDGGCSSNSGCSGGGDEGSSGNDHGDLGRVMSMLRDFQEEGFFRTIVRFL